MGNSRIYFTVAIISALGLGALHAAGKKHASPQVSITMDAASGAVVISWTGKGVLKQAADTDGHFKRVRTRGNSYVVEPTEQQMVFQLDGSPTHSANVVGYANLSLPPGLSLIANPLYYTNNTVGFWWPSAPDGAQVLKYVPDVGYEVSTFDALAGAWSNPDFDSSMGNGFLFRNTSAETITQTFIGEVVQGTLVNHLPAGLSMKAAMVPRSGSINTVQGIPGRPGEEIRFWVNDGQGGGDYISSIFSSEAGAWVPDLELHVGQGFWIEKQQPQDWVQFFSVN